MKKPTAAEIAREFRAASVAAKVYPRCEVCKMPEEIQDAIPICLEGENPLNMAELARFIGARIGKSIHAQTVKKHYLDHRKKAA